MSPGPVRSVDHADLALGRQLGQGGQGTVYEVTNKRINEADHGGWAVVYKEYGPAVLPSLDPAALAAMVNLLAELRPHRARWLCEKTAWPAAVVERAGRPTGFLMRAVPDRFRFAFRSLTGGIAGTERLANLEYLLNDDAYIAGVGLIISDRDRLGLLTDLATTLSRLHRMGIAVGDLSPKNLLFSTSPQAECFLVDCDAMRLRGGTVLPQAETPDWQLPDGEEKATPAGDVYKFALLAVRLTARDQTSTDPTALAALDPALGDLARSSLSTDPAHRPAPALWAEQLAAARRSASATTTPTAHPTGHPTGAAAGSGAGQQAARARAASTRPGPQGARARASSTGGPAAAAPLQTGGTLPGGTNASPKSGRAGAAVAAVLAVAVLAIGLANMLDGSDDDSASSLPSTYSAPGDPTGTSAAPNPVDTEKDDREPTHDEREPTYEKPKAPPPPPPPKPRYYYGAIAVGRNGSLGRAWDYSSASAARQHALSSCPGSCKVLTTFVNGCGAIVYNSATNNYWGGHGRTPAEAQRNARANAGGGQQVTWVCTTRPA